jgi:methionine sulfoxide reductase heme-binding subunit
MLRLLSSHPFSWLLLSLPAAYWFSGYHAGTFSYGELIHFTGDFGAQLLIVTLAVTPLRLLAPRAGWTMWLAQRRRDLGVAVFGYAVLHALVYLVRKAELARIVAEGRAPELLTGWIALLIFTALAITSNDASVRLLKRGWKKLHTLVYLAALLTFAHWVLTAFDPLVGFIHAGVLTAIETLRAVLQMRKRATRSPSP